MTELQWKCDKNNLTHERRVCASGILCINQLVLVACSLQFKVVSISGDHAYDTEVFPNSMLRSTGISFSVQTHIVAPDAPVSVAEFMRGMGSIRL